MTDPVMVDRVERLSGVEEEEEAIVLLRDGLVKKGVDVHHVVAPMFTGQKPFLAGRDVGADGRHNAACNARSKKPVVSVGDRKGAGVGDEAGEFFWEEEEETVVKTVRGVVSPEGAARSGAARQAAKGMPSGPGAVFLDRAIASSKESMVGSWRREGSTLLPYPLKKEARSPEVVGTGRLSQTLDQ